MNCVNILGRIATDLTLRTVRSSSGCVMNFKVAVDRYTPNGKVTDFIRCTAWGKNAERIERYFTKGSLIAISGSLSTGEYIDKNGIRRFTTDVFVKEYFFTGERNRRAEDQVRVPVAMDISEFEEVC